MTVLEHSCSVTVQTSSPCPPFSLNPLLYFSWKGESNKKKHLLVYLQSIKLRKWPACFRFPAQIEPLFNEVHFRSNTFNGIVDPEFLTRSLFAASLVMTLMLMYSSVIGRSEIFSNFDTIHRQLPLFRHHLLLLWRYHLLQYPQN